MVSIKILASTYSSCSRLEMVTQEVVDTIGIPADLQKVTDYSEIMNYSIPATPSLVINEKVVSTGRIPSRTEIETWIRKA